LIRRCGVKEDLVALDPLSVAKNRLPKDSDITPAQRIMLEHLLRKKVTDDSARD